MPDEPRQIGSPKDPFKTAKRLEFKARGQEAGQRYDLAAPNRYRAAQLLETCSQLPYLSRAALNFSKAGKDRHYAAKEAARSRAEEDLMYIKDCYENAIRLFRQTREAFQEACARVFKASAEYKLGNQAVATTEISEARRLFQEVKKEPIAGIKDMMATLAGPDSDQGGESVPA